MAIDSKMQGGAGCPARASRSGASLRLPRPCILESIAIFFICRRPPSAGGCGGAAVPAVPFACSLQAFRRVLRRLSGVGILGLVVGVLCLVLCLLSVRVG